MATLTQTLNFPLPTVNNCHAVSCCNALIVVLYLRRIMDCCHTLMSVEKFLGHFVKVIDYLRCLSEMDREDFTLSLFGKLALSRSWL